MDGPSVAVNWAARLVSKRQSSPAFLPCSPWQTSETKGEL